MNEIKRIIDYFIISSIIESCKTIEHLDSAKQMVISYEKTFFDIDNVNDLYAQIQQKTTELNTI